MTKIDVLKKIDECIDKIDELKQVSFVDENDYYYFYIEYTLVIDILHELIKEIKT